MQPSECTMELKYYFLLNICLKSLFPFPFFATSKITTRLGRTFKDINQLRELSHRNIFPTRKYSFKGPYHLNK